MMLVQCTCWITGRFNVLLHIWSGSKHIKVAAVKSGQHA